jgi:general secretion pathway protein H
MARLVVRMTMPTSTATKPSVPKIVQDNARGFSLVELMVVLFIIGIASTAVIMSVGSTERGVRDEAEQFAARVAALRDNAILQSRTMAVTVRPSGYGFETRNNGNWVALSEAPFSTTDWKSGTTVQMPGARQLRVAFDSTGLPSSAANIAIKRDNVTVTLKLAATGDIRVVR